MKIKELYILPEPSSSSESGVIANFSGKDLTLSFDYDKDGIICNHGLHFNNVRSFKFIAEAHCPTWVIEKAYDALIQLSDSNYLTELESETPSDSIDSWKMNHYVIYFDSYGCWEIIAGSWQQLPEKVGSLTQ